MIGGRITDKAVGLAARLVTPAAGAGQRARPYQDFNFHVELDGLIVAGFSEVSGLSSEIEIEERREGGVNNYIHKFPKITKHEDITLKRGITDSDVLWKWHYGVAQMYSSLEGLTSTNRRSGRIICYDSSGNEIRHWVFKNALPVKWSGPDFKADSSGIAIETLVLAHEGLEKFDLVATVTKVV